MQQMGAGFSQSNDIYDNETGYCFAQKNSSCDLVLKGDACFRSEIHRQLSETCSDDVMRV
jgi:predicted nicotinamide N-methyase